MVTLARANKVAGLKVRRLTWDRTTGKIIMLFSVKIANATQGISRLKEVKSCDGYGFYHWGVEKLLEVELLQLEDGSAAFAKYRTDSRDLRLAISMGRWLEFDEMDEFELEFHE